MKKILFSFLFFPYLCSAQIVSYVAGGGSFLGDGGPATSALMYDPGYLKITSNGVLYVSCPLDHRIRVIDKFGIIRTFAGTGSSGYSGDGGAATAAKIWEPSGIAIDTKGNFYFIDVYYNVIRKVNISTGIISTICGTGGLVGGYNGDGIPATAAQLSEPQDICVDKIGNLYIADFGNQRIRKIDTMGIIHTFAGTGTSGFSGDGGPATSALFNAPIGVSIDSNNSIYVLDGLNRRIRKITPAGIISTVAGNGATGFSGDGLAATNASFSPGVIQISASNELFISDRDNERICKVDNSGIFHWVAGNGATTMTGDGGPATAASMDPAGLAFDSCNNLLFTDIGAGHNVIRKVTFNPPPCRYLGVEPVASVPGPQIFPNPVLDRLYVEGLPTCSAFVLLNELGINCLSGSLVVGKNEIPVAPLPPGYYFLVLTDEWGNKSFYKVIKQ